MSTHLIKLTLSKARLSTYEKALERHSNFNDALELYAWNAEVSALFLMPLHICEITLRNAVSDAIKNVHGNRWPWAEGFERSLPAKGIYNPRNDLISSRKKQRHTDKVIPELNFVFWQKMLTARFDQELWQKHFYQAFPNMPLNDFKAQRQNLHDKVEKIRKLRNRIAHHEPIFDRNLQQDFTTIEQLVRARCTHTADWMVNHQNVTQLIK